MSYNDPRNLGLFEFLSVLHRMTDSMSGTQRCIDSCHGLDFKSLWRTWSWLQVDSDLRTSAVTLLFYLAVYRVAKSDPKLFVSCVANN